MNKLDKDYQALLQDILDNGTQKGDRTGTGTISVFGRQIRHKMSEGFPLLTTKKMYFKGIVTELLWFLRGDTNIKFLVDNDCHIWDGDAYKRYVKWVESPENQNNENEIVKIPISKEDFIKTIKSDDEIVKKMGKKYCDEFAKKWGELGPVYGKQWRRWEGNGDYRLPDNVSDWIYTESGLPVTEYKSKQIDQIANSINLLKTDPDSRRNRVNSWNVGELDQMVLPPCHTDFQFYTRELSWNERHELAETKYQLDDTDEELDKHNIPTRAISLMWNQRSVDTFLGLPFNIASYGLLLEIIAKEVNMVPDELIGNLGDTHLYLNHVEQAKEQIGRELDKIERVNYGVDVLGYESLLDYGHSQNEDELITKLCDEWGVPKRTREPYQLPSLKIKDGFDIVSGLDDIYEIDSFLLENYQSHPAIKAPLSN